MSTEPSPDPAGRIAQLVEKFSFKTDFGEGDPGFVYAKSGTEVLSDERQQMLRYVAEKEGRIIATLEIPYEEWHEYHASIDALEAERDTLTRKLADTELTLRARTAALLNAVKRQDELETERARLQQCTVEDENECNPFVARCGRLFCTYEEMVYHDRTHHAEPLPAPPPIPEATR